MCCFDFCLWNLPAKQHHEQRSSLNVPWCFSPPSFTSQSFSDLHFNLCSREHTDSNYNVTKEINLSKRALSSGISLPPCAGCHPQIMKQIWLTLRNTYLCLKALYLTALTTCSPGYNSTLPSRSCKFVLALGQHGAPLKSPCSYSYHMLGITNVLHCKRAAMWSECDLGSHILRYGLS